MGTLQMPFIPFCGNCSNCGKCRPENNQQLTTSPMANAQLHDPYNILPFCGNCGNCVKCQSSGVIRSPSVSQTQGGAQVTVPATSGVQQSSPTVVSSCHMSHPLGTGQVTLAQPSPPSAFPQSQGGSPSPTLPTILFPPPSNQVGPVVGGSSSSLNLKAPGFTLTMTVNTVPGGPTLPNGTLPIHSSVSSGVKATWLPTLRFPPSPQPLSLPSMQQSLPRPLLPLRPFKITANPAVAPTWESTFKVAVGNLVTSPFTRSQVNIDSNEYRVLSQMIGPLVDIHHLDRIVNPDLWLKFTNTRRELMRSKSNDWELLTALGLPEDEVHHRVQLGMTASAKVLGVDYSDNVGLLFHCTRGNVDEILSEGLDERLGRSNALLGKGIYFTDDPIKAISYDKWATLLIFAVFLGDCYEVDKVDERVRQNFVREPRKYVDEKRSAIDLSYDSIMGRPLSTNEFVIFNRHQCCPLYAVRYRTDTAGVKANSFPDDHFTLSRKSIPTFVWSPQSVWQARIGVAKPPDAGPVAWPFFAQTLFDDMNVTSEVNVQHVPEPKNDTVPTGIGEECTICCSQYDNAPGNWQVLDCSHKLCHQCYSSIQLSGRTMSGQHQTWVKCPFCQSCSGGFEIGSCPDGTMEVMTLSGESAAGYEGYDTLRISYKVPGTPGLKRWAYIPKTPEGEKMVDLLRIAWDRRLCFSIGTSITTGETNVLVWNIHHKSSLNGGSHGYPDSTYLNRVQLELAQYQIK